MYKKYTIPLNLFLILENIKIIYYSTKINNPNNIYIYIEKKNLFLFNKLLKNEFFTSYSTLIDISCIDTLFYNNFLFNSKNFFLKNRLIIFYIYYLYFLKIKLNLLIFFNNNNFNKLKSIDLIYHNSNWIEREFSEMFNVHLYFKKDIRKLLLNYSKNESPLLKDFPTEGYNDVFYNFFNELIELNNNNSVEL